jgi:peptidoglycan-associated lipoprotein
VIGQGQSTSLVWNTTNATETTISGIGVVAKSGTQSVTPTESITYTLTAKGPGGTVEANTRVTVNPPPPKPAPLPPSITEEELFTQNIRDVYFDYDKYDLRAGDSSTVDQDATFLKQHAGMKIVIEGHCDDRGSAEYNIALGQKRAETMKDALVNDGVVASRIRVTSVGKEKPFCTEDNEQCWQENRRAHVILDR